MKVEGDLIVGKGETLVLSGDLEITGTLRLIGSGQLECGPHDFHGRIDLSESLYGDHKNPAAGAP